MEPLITLFLLPTFAGYLILTKIQLYSVGIDRLNPTVLFVESFAYGLGILYLSYIFSSLVSGNAYIHLGGEFIEWWFNDCPFEIGAILHNLWLLVKWPINTEISRVSSSITQESILTIFIAGCYVYLCNRNLIKNSERYKSKLMAKRDKTHSLLEDMLYNAMNSLTPLQITLKNRKVYIGILLAMPEMNPFNKQEKFLELLPMKSGYRHPETLEIQGDMEDYSIMNDLLINSKNGKTLPNKASRLNKEPVNSQTLEKSLSYGIFIDMDEIISIGMWDNAIFKSFKEKKAKRGTK